MTNTDMELIVNGLSLNKGKKLRSFGLHDVQMPPKCLNSLASYLQLFNPDNFEEITLSNVDLTSSCDEICAMLQANTFLKRIKFMQCPNFFTSAGKIGQALAKHTNIEELYLSSPNNRVPPEFFMTLPFIVCDTKIKKLILDGLSINVIQDFVMEKLKVSIGNSQTLEHLDLSNI